MPSSASIQRYIRRHVHKQPFDIFVACLPVLENDTLTEIQHLIPGLVPSAVKGGVSVRATLPDVYRLNLGLSTANRILLRLRRFPAWSFPMLFGNANRIFWPAFVSSPSKTEIRVTSRMSRLNMQHRVASTLRSAIESTFGDYPGDSSGGTSTIYVRIVRDDVTLSLDTTGDHLHKRGDKVLTDVAPLRSTLAAFALKPMLAEATTVLCDPFCGSGTILMEGTRIIRGIAPGGRRTFAFMQHPYFRAGSWRQARRDDRKYRRANPTVRLAGGDVRDSAVEITRANLTALLGRGESEHVDLSVRDFRPSLDAVRGARGATIVTNPPYGVRLGDRTEAQQLQWDFASHLEAFPSPLKFAVFTPFPDIYLDSALRIDRVVPLRLGGIKISLVHGHGRQH